MSRRVLLALAAPAVLLPLAPASAAIRAETLSVKRYARHVVVRHERVTIAGRSSLVTTVTVPKPGRGMVLEPVLAGDMVSHGTATTSDVSRVLGRRGIAVAINADLFEYASGQPSGLFLLGGEIYNQPQGGRPALSGDQEGNLSVSRPRAAGRLTIGQRTVPFEINVRRDRGVVLYDHGWGPRAPAGAGRSVVGRVVDAELRRARVWSIRGHLRARRSRRGGLPIPSDASPDLLFQARGRAARALARARRGAPMTVRYRVGPLPHRVHFGLGGGPILVRDGRLVYRRDANREFSDDQLNPPDARTAIAQLRDGRVVFYAVDRGAGSPGFTVAQVARDLRRRGAQTAMAFDSGGSTALSVDGRVLNQPADGVERPVGNMLVYYRGDGKVTKPIAAVSVGRRDEGDRAQPISYTLLKGARVQVAVFAPGGRVHTVIDGVEPAGTHRVEIPPAVLRPGRWEVVVTAARFGDEVSRRFTVAKEPAPAAVPEPAAAGERPQADAVTGPVVAEPDDGDGVVGWIVALAGIALGVALGSRLVRRRRRDRDPA